MRISLTKLVLNMAVVVVVITWEKKLRRELRRAGIREP
jgi:hypothetical protein